MSSTGLGTTLFKHGKICFSPKQQLCYLLIFIQQADTCSPSGLDCYRSTSADTYNCTTTCEGVFADVVHINDADRQVQDQAKIDMMVAAYDTEKQAFASNLYFTNTGNESSYYGQY